MNRYKQILLSISVGVAIILIWQFIYSAELVSRLVLPSPRGVFFTTISQLLSGAWVSHIITTLVEFFLGFILGIIMAIIFGAVFAYVDILRKSLFPYILAGQTFPKIAIAPLLVAWLGYGLEPKILIALILAFFPVFVNTLEGLTNVGRDQLDLLKSLKATPLQEFIYLRFPNALSYIFPALTLAAVNALLGAIVGEFVGSSSGLGFLIQQLSFQGDLEAVYGVLIMLSAIGLSVYGVIKLVERRFHHTVV